MQSNISYRIVNNVFLTAQKHVGHDWSGTGRLTSDIAVFTSDFAQCAALI